MARGQSASPPGREQRQDDREKRANQRRGRRDVDGFQQRREEFYQMRGQKVQLGRGIRDHVGGKIEKLRQTGPETARVAFIGEHEARNQHQHEDRQHDAAVESFSLDHRHIGVAGMRMGRALGQVRHTVLAELK